MNNLELLFHLLIIFISLFSIVYTFGVVWRVEKKLDTSFKLLLGAIISFTLSEIIFILPFDWSQLFSLILKTIFIILFLAGILEMRYMLRKMDGELKK